MEKTFVRLFKRQSYTCTYFFSTVQRSAHVVSSVVSHIKMHSKTCNLSAYFKTKTKTKSQKIKSSFLNTSQDPNASLENISMLTVLKHGMHKVRDCKLSTEIWGLWSLVQESALPRVLLISLQCWSLNFLFLFVFWMKSNEFFKGVPASSLSDQP